MTLSTYKSLEAAAIVTSVLLLLVAWSSVIWLDLDGYWPFAAFVGGFLPYVLIVNMLLKGYVRRRYMAGRAMQPSGLISVLLETANEFGDRHDAAMNLASYDEPEVIAALMKVKNDPKEDGAIVEEAEQSLLEIHRRLSQS